MRNEVTTEMLAKELGRVAFRNVFVGLLQNANLIATALEQHREVSWSEASDWRSLECELRRLFGEYEHLAGDGISTEGR